METKTYGNISINIPTKGISQPIAIPITTISDSYEVNSAKELF